MWSEIVLFCNDPILETWSPDFSSSGSANPEWTRVRSGGTELCNSLEYTSWDQNPVQVQLCDACGTIGCASGGYIHLSAFGNHVLWTIPQGKRTSDGIDASHPATALVRFGAIAFPNEAWNLLRAAEAEVPAIERLSPTNGLAILDAWAIGPGRPQAVDQLLPMLRARLLSGDTLDTTSAIEWIDRWLRWFDSRADQPMDGNILNAALANATIETLYFDGPRGQDWPALARVGEAFVPVLDPTHIFVPTDRQTLDGSG